MELYPIPLPSLPERAHRGWARSLHRGPRTVAEILADASVEMDAEDAGADAVEWFRAARRRRGNLWSRLFGRGR